MSLALVVLVLAGCGSEESGSGSGGGGATGGGSTEPAQFAFTGYVFQSGGETRICDAILESYPPQCGGESYVVEGFDLSSVGGVDTAQGVSWTQGQLTLRGTLADDGSTLVIPANPGLRGDLPPPTVGEQPGSAPG